MLAPVLILAVYFYVDPKNSQSSQCTPDATYHNFPFLLLKNGGGIMVKTKAEQVSKLLNIEIATDRVVTACTIIQREAGFSCRGC